MIAENFYRNGFNIFNPQINWTGDAAGYIGKKVQASQFALSARERYGEPCDL